MRVSRLVLHPTAEKRLDGFLASPAHAVLFGGPAGTGKVQLAHAAALELLGGKEAHLRTVTAVGESIGIEQIRELNGFFALKVPGTAAVKRVVIIEDAERMGTEAQNALLKLLEEPPADAVLILTSSQPERLLPTIRSRLQKLHLPAPTPADLQKHFAEAGHNEAVVSAALLRAGTSVAAAERILVAGTDAPDTAVQLVKQALGGTAYDRLLLVDALSKQKEELRTFVDTLATVAMASLEAAVGKGAASVSRWKDVLQAAHTAQNALSQSGNAKLVLTELMLEL
ncbi:MAG TPA: AAA family ATPase [Candidatus Saccharimonadales bacterium]|nr:AAA family ATPase [Candidatus Saccharimonadales bacterium]